MKLRFRKNNLRSIRQVCRQFTLVCKQLKLFSGELGAIDGSKFRALNSKKRNFTRDKLKKLIEQIDERVETYLEELDRQEDQDDQGTPGGAQAEALQAKSEWLKARKLLYEGLQAQLQESGQEQLSLRDPESRSMLLGKGRGVEVCYGR